MSEEKVAFYIKTDIIGSTIISDEIEDEIFQSSLSKFKKRNKEFFGDHKIKLIRSEGDGELYEASNLNEAIKTCLDLCRKNKVNPIVAKTEDNKLSYRLSMKLFIASGLTNSDNHFDKLQAKITKIEKAVNYPENSVILDKATFDLTESSLRQSNIVHKDIIFDIDKEKTTVVYIERIDEGLLARPPEPKYIEKRMEELLEKIAKYKEERMSFVKTTQNLKTTRIILIAAISVVSVSLIFSSFVLIEELEKANTQLYENQYNTVKSSVINKIQSLIDSSHVLENTIILGYTEGQDKEDFIEKRMEELRRSALYDPKKIPVKNSLYFYIMSPHPECKFLLYSHVEFMKRDNGLGLEACEGELDLFITGNYPSTGTNEFTNGLVQKIALGNDPDTRYDLISTIAIDWDNFSNEIKDSDIALSDVQFVLVDKNNYVVMDCTPENCKSMHRFAQSLDKPIDADSRYVEFDPADYSTLTEYKNESFQKKDFYTYGIVRINILDGWNLYMFVDDNKAK